MTPQAPVRPALSDNPCIGCGVTVRRSLADRASCRACHGLAWRWWVERNRGSHPDIYQRAYNRAWGTVDGLRETILAARADAMPNRARSAVAAGGGR